MSDAGSNDSKPTDDKPAEQRKPLPTLEELKAKGFKIVPSSGKSFILPVGKVPPRKP